VSAIYAALADDPHALGRLIDADAPLLGFPALDGEQARGHAGLQRVVASYRPYFRTFAVTPVEIASGDERVLVRLRLGGVGLSGAELWHDAFHVHTVSDGRCIRIEAFEDPGTAARAAGLDRS
jgi:ketosteroid isomerase-like protein